MTVPRRKIFWCVPTIGSVVSRTQLSMREMRLLIVESKAPGVGGRGGVLEPYEPVDDAVEAESSGPNEDPVVGSFKPEDEG